MIGSDVLHSMLNVRPYRSLCTNTALKYNINFVVICCLHLYTLPAFAVLVTKMN